MTAVVAMLLIGGLMGLVVSAHFLVDGAARIGVRVGVPAVIVGLTLVAFGTSAPELAVSLQASLTGSADIAVGNIVGSNIFNVLLILGLSAVILPLAVHRQLLQRDVPVMVVLSLLVWWLASDGLLSTLDGLLLVSLLLAYIGAMVLAVRNGRAALQGEAAEAAEKAPRALWIDLLCLVGGLVGLVISADWLVSGAVSLARALGVSELVIGLTIVSLGTSLPELATSLMAAIKGERDIAVGNIVGSNIFNLLSVLGLTALIAPVGLTISTQALSMDFPVMVAVALLCVPIFLIGRQIGRIDGTVMLLLLVCYLGVLLALARGHVLTAGQQWWLLAGVALTVLVSQTWSWWQHRRTVMP